MATTPKDRPVPLPRRPGSVPGHRLSVERRRSPSGARSAADASAGAITLTVMRDMIASADALRAHLESEDRDELSAADLTRNGSDLADLVRHFQAALRRFVKDWLRDRRQTAWLVHASSGRTLSIDDRVRPGATLASDTEVMLAEDQPLNGIRRSITCEGLGLAVACRSRRPASEPESALDPAHTPVARAWTVLVGVVAHHSDRRLRTVHVELLDPGETPTRLFGGVRLPLAADFTAPVALSLGLQRKPAATAYGLSGSARRGTIGGFSALTPFGAERAPLVLLEGVGLSATLMANIANEVAGDPLLRRRYQVWLYRYPVTAPLFVAASAFRADLGRFSARLARATGRSQRGRIAIVARGAGAVIAKSLLGECGPAVWNSVFSVPPERLDVAPRERMLLNGLFHRRLATEIDRVVTLGEPQSGEALVAGVGARAVQVLLRQPSGLRGSVERIYAREKGRLVARLPSLDSTSVAAITADGYPEPVRDAIAAAAIAAEHALLALGAPDGSPADEARLYRGSEGLRPVASLPTGSAEARLEPLVMRRALGWLRADWDRLPDDGIAPVEATTKALVADPE